MKIAITLNKLDTRKRKRKRSAIPMFFKGREKHVENFVLFENACGICKKTVEIVIISVETVNKRCENV